MFDSKKKDARKGNRVIQAEVQRILRTNRILYRIVSRKSDLDEMLRDVSEWEDLEYELNSDFR